MRHEFQEEESGVFGLGGWAACRDEIIRKQSNENKTKKKAWHSELFSGTQMAYMNKRNGRMRPHDERP